MIDENPAESVDLTQTVEEKAAMDAQDEIEATPPVPNDVEKDIEAQEIADSLDEIEDTLTPEPEMVESVEDVIPGQQFEIGADDPVEIISKEDVLEGDSPEASDAPELQEPAEDGEGRGTDEPEEKGLVGQAVDRILGRGDTDQPTEPYNEPETQEPPEEPDAPEEDEPVAEAPKRNVNPRNTRA